MRGFYCLDLVDSSSNLVAPATRRGLFLSKRAVENRTVGSLLVHLASSNSFDVAYSNQRIVKHLRIPQETRRPPSICQKYGTSESAGRCKTLLVLT